MTIHPTTRARMSLADLVALTTAVAEDVRAGLYEVHADENDQWHVQLVCDGQVDVWLISWTVEQDSQLHDHGGSSGAFSVVSGRLREAAWAPGTESVVEHVRSGGDSVVFGEGYVHDIRSLPGEAAVSVHAYSPPLARTSYYDVENRQLVRLATVDTEGPEAQTTGLPIAS